MAIIVIDPLIDLNAGAGTEGATGTVTCQAFKNGIPLARIHDSSVTLPAPIVVNFKNGILDADIDLDVLADGAYWRMIIEIGLLKQVYFFHLHTDGTYDLGDLTMIDPRA